MSKIKAEETWGRERDEEVEAAGGRRRIVGYEKTKVAGGAGHGKRGAMDIHTKYESLSKHMVFVPCIWHMCAYLGMPEARRET